MKALRKNNAQKTAKVKISYNIRRQDTRCLYSLCLPYEQSDLSSAQSKNIYEFACASYHGDVAWTIFNDTQN